MGPVHPGSSSALPLFISSTQHDSTSGKWSNGSDLYWAVLHRYLVGHRPANRTSTPCHWSCQPVWWGLHQYTPYPSSALTVTNNRHIVIWSYTWMLVWPNASSVVTLASNGSDTGLSLSAARTAGSHYIVAGSTKSWHGRTRAFVIRYFVRQRRNIRSIKCLRMRIDVNVKGSSMRSLRAFALLRRRVFHNCTI